MGDTGIIGEPPLDVGAGREGQHRKIEGRHVEAQSKGELAKAKPVEAVLDDEEPSFTRHQGLEPRLDGVGGASLDGHALVGVRPVAEVEEIAPHFLGELAMQLGVGAAIAHHLRLHLRRHGERARGQQVEIVPAFGHGAVPLSRWPEAARSRPGGGRAPPRRGGGRDPGLRPARGAARRPPRRAAG